jgi:hypothetical protein
MMGIRVDFTENNGGLAPGWNWVRGNEEDWHLIRRDNEEEGAIEIRIRPGSIYGPVNDARNLLIRELPVESRGVEAIVEMRLEIDYEQAGILWYYDDDHYVKLVLERLDSERHAVFVREEGADAVVVAKTRLDSDRVALRILLEPADGDRFGRLAASYRLPESAEWSELGQCPSFPEETPGLLHGGVFGHCGSDEDARWATFRNFEIL